MLRFLVVSAALLIDAGASAAATLKIVQAGVQQIEDGPPVGAGVAFVPGETIYVSFQIEGYRPSPDQKVHLSYSMDAFDPKGVKIVESVESAVDSTLAPEDKNWKPKARHPIAIPPLAPSGEYSIAIHAKDDNSHETADATLKFTVRGQDIAPSPALTVQNFAFYRKEDDATPLSTPAYRPGDALWARFDITGYKLGDQNTVEVSYGVAVLNSGGKAIYSQPQAATEKSFSFYPKPFVPGGMNLSLQSNMRPGEYTIVLSVHDLVGHQDYESKYPFRVE